MPLEADAIQGFLFFSPGQPQVDAQEIWSNLVPSERPDSFNSVNTSPALASMASGLQNGLRLTINVQVGMVAITVGPVPPEANVAPPFSRIADVVSAVKTVSNFLNKLLRGRSINRCAIVLNLAMTVENGDEESAMRSALPGHSFPSGASDIIAQFNLRRTFNHNSSLQMNRICTWSSGQSGFIQFNMGLGQQTPIMTLMTPFISLKVDVNTAPELRIIPEEYDQIVDDLTNEAILIYEQGMKRFEQ